MVKQPRAGRVKTRLGRDIGMTAAAWWFRHQSAALIRRLRDPRWETVLAVAPDAAVVWRNWPEDLRRLPQGAGDLGDRMTRMLQVPPGRKAGQRPSRPPTGRALYAHPARDGRCPFAPVCLIGADIPGITKVHITRAFSVLGDHDAVFGPADDGGYWLVGLKHPRRQPPGFMTGVRWSTEHALTDTLATLPGHRIALTDTLRDVDTAADLAALNSHDPARAPC
jgi:hypothetical protein